MASGLSGTVTCLFAEIDRAVELWEESPVEMQATSTRCSAIIHSAVEAHGGTVTERAGDVFGAVFPSAHQAVGAALDAQRRLVAEARSSRMPLRVRMGVCTGDAQLRQGGYSGPAVSRAIQLMSSSVPGQVLVAEVARLLVGERLPAGAYWRSLGDLQVGDSRVRERVWQLRHDDLPLDLPRAGRGSGGGNNLPTLLTPMIGRDAETRAVTAALLESRLVTLVGTGGVGKTRLAQRVSNESLDEFPGGVWWADLALVSDPGSVAAAVLGAIGVSARPGGRPAEAINDQIGDRDTLFVLDNCEHVVDAAAAFVDELLSALASVTVLATSREPLFVPGETVWRVPPLDLPDEATGDIVAALEGSASGLLFLDRARRAGGEVVVTPEAAAAIAQICRRLDGIPLSIELAAARSRNLSVEQISRELDDRFRLLTGGSRTVLERQQTLRACIDWSHELLGEAERATLRRLGVFSGPFTTDAAESVVSAVSGDLERENVLELVDSLADKSLITVAGFDSAGGSRFRLLETIRHYALDHLVAAGEADLIRRAHAAFWADWATRHDVYFDAGLALTDTVPTHLADLMAATRWAIENDLRLLVPLMECIGPFLESEESDPDAGGLFETVLAALDGRDDPGWAVVAAVWEFAKLFWGDFSASHDLADRARALAAEHDLHLAHAILDYADAFAFRSPPSGFVTAAENFAAAGSSSWSRLTLATGIRYFASAGDFATADALLATIRGPLEAPVRGALTTAELQLAITRGQLGGEIERVRPDLARIRGNERGRFFTYEMNAWVCVAAVAFFTLDRDVLEWAVDTLGREARGRIAGRLAQVAAAHLDLVDGPDAAAAVGGIDRLYDRLSRSSTGGGLYRRETPYLAVAAADPEWIAAERRALGQLGADGWATVACSMEFLDAVAALQRDDDASAHHHFHEMLALASDRALGLFWIDAVEGLAVVASRSGTAEEAERLAGAAGAAREARAYRFRYPHLDELPAGAEGPVLSLEEATTYLLRTRTGGDRPVSGWDALTPSETEVARAVARGLTNKEAAERLFISVPTVKTHLRHIYAKLEIDNRSQLAAMVTELNP